MLNSNMKFVPGRKRRTADRRGDKPIIDKEADGEPVAKRMESKKSSSKDNRCGSSGLRIWPRNQAIGTSDQYLP